MSGEPGEPEAVEAERVLQEVAKRVSLRETHPTLFRSLLTVAAMEIAQALNFFTSHPTFNPLPRHVIGSIFLVLGVGLAVALTVYRRLILVRLFGVASGVVMLSWGSLNTRQWIDGKASGQLPIYVATLGALTLWWVIEPWLNPLTANGNGKKLFRRA